MTDVLKVQIRDENDKLLTEWRVTPQQDGSDVAIVREVEWLRRVADSGRTLAEMLAES